MILGPLAFRLAAWRNDDAALGRTSDSDAALMAELKGKRVAIVGNARALGETAQGAAIDAADLIVRINRAPMPSPTSHGARTDWLALATSLDQTEYERINPSRLLWMSHKRKRLRRWMAATPGFYLHPAADFAALTATLGARPTTGTLMIALIARSHAAELHLHGFDFFASQSLTGHRDATAVPHDFGAEARWVHGLSQTDPRITLHAMK